MYLIRHYALIFMTLAIIAGNIHAQTTTVIKFSHTNSPFSPKGKAAIHFKELAEKMTKGKVRVDIYPESQLYNDYDELEALQLNAVQMLAPPLSKFSALGLHEFELFDLPYLFPSIETVHLITQGSIGRDLLSTLEPKGIIGLQFWDNGFKNMFSNKPIHTPNDMRGLKMRIQPSTVLTTQMHDLGATAFALSFQDMVSYLQNRLIDGFESPPSTYYLSHFGKMRYLTLTNHGYLGYAIIVNKDFWDGLPAEIRVQLNSALIETSKYANTIAQQQNELDLLNIKKSEKISVIELTDAEKILWRNALLPVQKKMENRIGKELITNVNQVIANTHK